MKRVIKTCCLILAIAMACTVLFACGNNPGGPTIPPDSDISVEGNVKFTTAVAKLSDQKAADAFIAAFTEKYPKASVTKDYNPGNIPARIASGEIGDVFGFSEVECYNYAITQKSLMSLNQYIDPLGIDTSSVYSGVLALGQVEGELYMVPKDYNHVVFIYNKTALKEAGLADPQDGWTWDEFKDYATKLTLTDPNDASVYTQVGGNLNYLWDPVYVPFFEGWGGKWVDTENKVISLTTDEVRKGIDELLNLAKTGAIKPELGNTEGFPTDAEKYVFRSMVYPNITSMGSAYDTLNLDWDFVSFPAFPTHKVGTGCSGFGVYKYTSNPNTAAALALFFFTAEGQRAYNGNEGGSVPLVKELSDEGFWRYNDLTNTGADWSGKNYDAFVSFPEADTVGRVNCKMPAKVAAIVTGGWESVVKDFFDTGSYMDSLTQLEKSANDTWQRLIRQQE